VDFLTGYPHELHMDERMIEEERNRKWRRPHPTLERVDARST
jgi:hypothetical protein